MMIMKNQPPLIPFFATVGEKVASNFPTTTVDGLSFISRSTPTTKLQ